LPALASEEIALCFAPAKMPKKILITAIGGDIAQSILKCLKDTGYDIYPVGCDIDPYAAGKKDIATFLIAPRVAEGEKYFRFIKNTVTKYGIKYIYPTTEAEITFFDKNREYFEKNRITVFINSRFIIDTFSDKYKTANFLKSKSLSYPATFLVREYKGELGYPLIIKPRRGCGSKGVVKVNDARELDIYTKLLPEGIVQEYLGDENEEYTTGIFSDGKKVYSITFRRKIGFGGVSKMIDLASNSEIDEIARKFAESSNLTGSVNIQSRKTDGRFIVFEVNPRFSSTVYFRHYFGFQDLKWWLDMIEKKEINFQLKYKKGVGIRTLGEVFFDCR